MNKKLFLMHISQEFNGKSRVEYEMSNKQWIINEIFSEKAKKNFSTFIRIGKLIFVCNSMAKKHFPCQMSESIP